MIHRRTTGCEGIIDKAAVVTAGTALSAMMVCAILVAAPSTDPETVNYTITAAPGAQGLTSLSIGLHFKSDSSGRTTLRLPSDYASETGMWRYIRNLRVDGASAVVEDAADTRSIVAPSGAELDITYDVVGASDADLAIRPNINHYLPLLHSDWTFDYGVGLFAYPDGQKGSHATFRWGPAPSTWQFASDLDHMASGARPGTVADVLDSIIIGGRDLRVITRMIGKTPLRVAVLGRWSFEDRELADLVEKTIASERAFWPDEGEPYLVAVRPLPVRPNSSTVGGTGLGDAFAFNVSNDAPLSAFRTMLAHEYFHTWNPVALGSVEEGDAEGRDKWFSEGFTDFYAWRLGVRSGILTPADFAAAWNVMLHAYANSSVRLEPNARVERDYFKDAEVKQLPYQRGAQLAAVWDAKLRRASGGQYDMDEVLREMRRRVATGDRLRAPVLFRRVYADLGGGDLSDDMSQYVDRGLPITLPDDLFDPCAVVKATTYPSFDRGYDPAATASTGLVAGVKANSPAYLAGLRNGMKYIRREQGVAGDSRQRYVLRVADDQGEHEISFRPEGAGRVVEQQLELRGPGELSDSAVCGRRLGGISGDHYRAIDKPALDQEAPIGVVVQRYHLMPH